MERIVEGKNEYMVMDDTDTMSPEEQKNFIIEVYKTMSKAELYSLFEFYPWFKDYFVKFGLLNKS